MVADRLWVKHGSRIGTAFFLAAIIGGVAQTQSPPTSSGLPQFGDDSTRLGEGDLVMSRMARDRAEGVLGNVVKGFTADRLPATFTSGPKGCTVTLIGPTVALTAAHCVLVKKVGADGMPVLRKIVLGRPESSATARSVSCEVPREYLEAPLRANSPSMAADIALCELDKRPGGVRAETPMLTPALSARDSRLMLAGYGCRIVVGENGALLEKPVVPAVLAAGMVTVSGEDNGWQTSSTRVGGADAYVCPGDSGGAIYARADPAKPNNSGWAVVGVISGYKKFGDGAVTSYLSPLSHPAVAAFFEHWRHNVSRSLLNQHRKVCGLDITGAPTLCRS